MYNRYVPQPDGSYCRRKMAEPPIPAKSQQAKWQPAPPPCEPQTAPQPAPACPPHPRPAPGNIPRRRPQPRPHREERREPDCHNGGIMDFLRHLLPKDFDTGDLLIVLLLLLMSGDCQEDQNTALLTLVLYLFL